MTSRKSKPSFIQENSDPPRDRRDGNGEARGTADADEARIEADLKKYYDAIVKEPVPERLTRLLDDMKDAPETAETPNTETTPTPKNGAGGRKN